MQVQTTIHEQYQVVNFMYGIKFYATASALEPLVSQLLAKLSGRL